MIRVGRLAGTGPTIKRYQVSASLTRVGIPLLAVASAEAGLDLATTTSMAGMVGINFDLATYATGQVAGGSPEALVSVCIDPDTIYKAYISGGAASGTAFDERDVTSAASDGLSVTTGDAFDSPTYDEGSIWGATGSNIGQLRKITSVSSSAATVTVAFDHDTVVGDLYGYAPFFPMAAQTVTLTTELDEIRQDQAVATNTGELICIELIPNNFLLAGQDRPFALFMASDHLLA